MRRLACALLVVLLVALLLPAAPAAAEGTHVAPVPAGTPLLDRFRPPEHAYGPGNRGIDYATPPGTAVTASADGEVVFAGPVAGSRHVVVLHPGGLRTSYSFLASVSVRRGDRVAAGDEVGVAGAAVHFGVRAGDQYLDPEALLRGEAPSVRLVPLEDLGARSVADEAAGLLRSLAGAVAGGVVRAGEAGVAWARDGAGLVVGELRARWEDLVTSARLLALYQDIPGRFLQVLGRAEAFLATQHRCTPAAVAPRARPPGRRIAVLVGGLGSRSGDAAVLDVDTRALGYAESDVAQFSYRGGQSPGRRRLEDVPTSSYDAGDSTGDIRAASEHLRGLLASIRQAHPGVPVDLLAHSMGGLVVRGALGERFDAVDPRLPPVEHVITLGTPHQGADLATINAAVGVTLLGPYAQEVLDRFGVASTSAATAQLAEIAPYLEALARRPLPAGARVTSIAARGDLIAPALSSALEGATNVLVPLDGLSAHDRLPGSAAAQREVALALAGMGPTCRHLGADVLASAIVDLAGDVVGGGITAADLLLGLRGQRPASPPGPDGRYPGPVPGARR